MGYYLETRSNRGKAKDIVLDYGGKIVSQTEATDAMNDPTKAVVVVVDNGMFEAAGFAYDLKEFGDFTLPHDNRRKEFVILPREKVLELIPRYKGK